MKKNEIINYFSFFMILMLSNSLYAQIGLRPNWLTVSDSTKVKNSIKWQYLKNWQNYKPADLSLKYYNQYNYFGKNYYHPACVMPKDPFKIDYRSGSYYVPRMVKDELNLIMNRPRDNSFIPILGVAFIAAQMASKYLFFQDKLKISAENLLSSLNDYEILNSLWGKNPQTVSELYANPKICVQCSRRKLETRIMHLIDNKLLKQKKIQDREMQFFPAISKPEYKELLQQASGDTSISEQGKNKIKLILTNKITY